MITRFPSTISWNPSGHARNGTVLFLHANSYSAGLYRSFLAPLYSKFEVWAPDLPGHGNSRWNGLLQGWSDLSDYYIKYFDQNPPTTPLVGMGHSIGGVLIMLMAIQRPQWFSHLILLDPVLLPKPILWLLRGLKLLSLTHIVPLAKAAERRRNIFKSREEALRHFSTKTVFSAWEPEYLQAYVETCLYPNAKGNFQLACTPQLESSIYQSLPLNAWALPGRINIPSLFIIGRHSNTVNQRGFGRLQKLRGNHVVKSIDGGHLFPFEKPGATMDLIKDFLAQ